jgi:hypothetical protein
MVGELHGLAWPDAESIKAQAYLWLDAYANTTKHAVALSPELRWKPISHSSHFEVSAVLVGDCHHGGRHAFTPCTTVGQVSAHLITL